MNPHNFYERLAKAQLRGNTPPSELKLLEEVAEYLRVMDEDFELIGAETMRQLRRAEAAEAEVERLQRILAAHPDQLTTSVGISEVANAMIDQHDRNSVRWKQRAEAAEAKLRAVENAIAHANKFGNGNIASSVLEAALKD